MSPPSLRVVSTQPVGAPRATTWTHADLVAPETLDVHYTEGSPACDVLANVRGHESAEAVTATVYTGVPASAPEGLTGRFWRVATRG